MNIFRVNGIKLNNSFAGQIDLTDNKTISHEQIYVFLISRQLDI